ncbi:hypothetical protein N9F71_00240 [bacterium]|nr:hypothetical protein [bacterium]MDB4435706.1 hypothetical protein [bacterium]
MLKVYGVIALVVILGGVGYAAKSYYNDTQDRIQQLAENNATLKAAAEEQQATINTMQETAEVQAALTKDLMKNLQKAEAYSDGLLQKFKKHNLTLLSLRKPGLIEKRINDGTTKIFADLESDTAK